MLVSLVVGRRVLRRLPRLGLRRPDRRSVIANPLPGTIKLATPLIFGALAGVPVRARRRHQHRDRGPVPGRRVLRLGGLQRLSTAPRWACSAASSPASLIAALLAVFAIRYQVNQVVLGVVLIVLATGLTGFLLEPDPGRPDDQALPQRAADPGADADRDLRLAVGRDIPVIGPTLFNQTLLVYLMYVSVVVRDRAAVPDPVGPAGPRGRRAPEGRRHGRHQGQPDALAGGAPRRRRSPASAAPTSPSAPPAPSTRTPRPATASSRSPR